MEIGRVVTEIRARTDGQTDRRTDIGESHLVLCSQAKFLDLRSVSFATRNVTSLEDKFDKFPSLLQAKHSLKLVFCLSRSCEIMLEIRAKKNWGKIGNFGTFSPLNPEPQASPG